LEASTLLTVFESRTERPSLRLVLCRVWQRALVLEDLAEITAIDPASAAWAADEMLGLIPWRIANAPSNAFTAGDTDHCCCDLAIAICTAPSDLMTDLGRLKTRPSRPP
jgi:hypothetical protein